MKSLSTALRVFTAFASGKSDWGVGELAEHCGITKGQVSKILAVYRQHGLLKQDPASRRYSVDLRSYVIGAQFLIRDTLARHALPVMRHLTQTSGHSVRLCVRDGDKLIYLLVTVGPHLLESGWRAGSALPWHTTSGGRIMLAYMDEGERETILDAAERDPALPLSRGDRARLERLIAQARADGYAIVRNQATLGLGAISVPVLGADQRVIASLAIAFPDDLIASEDELALIEPLHEAARALSLRNGAQVYSIRAPAATKPTRGKRRVVAPAR